MITPEQKCKFLSLLQKECPFNVVDFQVEEDEVDMYWITLPLPEPYEGFDARNIFRKCELQGEVHPVCDQRRGPR